MGSINRKSYRKNYVIFSLLVVAIVMSTLIYSAQKSDKHITTNTQYTVMKETTLIKELVDSSIGYAFNSIQVVASQISQRITEEEIDDPSQIIRELLPSTPFSAIEYIRKDGRNITDAGEPFDASDREYYIKGMEGKTGIWINYTPKYSKGSGKQWRR